MLRFNLFFAAILVALFTLTNCKTAQKYVETGNYDAAIDYCVDHLSGRKNKPEDLVKGLELAFQKATERDMRAADALIADNNAANWERVYQIHRQIQLRQDKVNPLIPLKDKKGYEANFRFVNIEKLLTESRSNAAEHLYITANEDMKRARLGDKAAARSAYYTLRDLERKYFPSYKNKEAIQREAKQLGMVHILFEIKNETNQLMPRHFNERILAISKKDLDSEWKTFYFNDEPGFTYEYKAIFRLNNIDISPERIHERAYTDEKEIQDGWEYVYDTKGRVKKDSLGNEIKHPRLIIVRANVLEVFQTKAARITGSVDIMNIKGTQRLDSRPLATEVLFEHYASTFNGDTRALSDQTTGRIGNRPAPFPVDEDMLVQAADRLRPSLSYELNSMNVLR